MFTAVMEYFLPSHFHTSETVAPSCSSSQMCVVVRQVPLKPTCCEFSNQFQIQRLSKESFREGKIFNGAKRKTKQTEPKGCFWASPTPDESGAASLCNSMAAACNAAAKNCTKERRTTHPTWNRPNYECQSNGVNISLKVNDQTKSCSVCTNHSGCTPATKSSPQSHKTKRKHVDPIFLLDFGTARAKI